MSSDVISLRYAGRCVSCGSRLERGDRAHYDRARRQVRCRGCRPSEDRLSAAMPAVAGMGARSSEPDVERKGAAALERWLRDKPAVVLHARANIDHLAIGPGGITVIDTKRLHGRIRVERRGLFSSHTDLTVAGRRRTTLIDGVKTQITAVREALAGMDLDALGVRGALQFIDGELPLIGRLPDIDGIGLGPPRAIAKFALRPGPLGEGEVRAAADRLAALFPPD